MLARVAATKIGKKAAAVVSPRGGAAAPAGGFEKVTSDQLQQRGEVAVELKLLQELAVRGADIQQPAALAVQLPKRDAALRRGAASAARKSPRTCCAKFSEGSQEHVRLSL